MELRAGSDGRAGRALQIERGEAIRITVRRAALQPLDHVGRIRLVHVLSAVFQVVDAVHDTEERAVRTPREADGVTQSTREYLAVLPLKRFLRVEALDRESFDDGAILVVAG